MRGQYYQVGVQNELIVGPLGCMLGASLPIIAWPQGEEWITTFASYLNW